MKLKQFVERLPRALKAAFQGFSEDGRAQTLGNRYLAGNALVTCLQCRSVEFRLRRNSVLERLFELECMNCRFLMRFGAMPDRLPKALLQIRSESLPTRCEICHQDDLFDPQTGVCRRCVSLRLPG